MSSRPRVQAAQLNRGALDRSGNSDMLPAIRVLSLLLSLQSTGAPQVSLDSVSFVWREGLPPYTLSMVRTFDTVTEDSVLSLRIRGRDQPAMTVSLPGGLVPLAKGLLDSAIAKDNLLHSRYLYLAPRLRDARGTPMLLVFGWAFASDPGSIVILTLTPGGQPVEVLRDSTFLLTDIDDLNGDRVQEIVGKRSLSEIWGRCFETYDPYAVYRFRRRATTRALYDSALSRSYTVTHYVGWAGPTAREDVAVVRCARGGPRLMPAKQAEREYP